MIRENRLLLQTHSARLHNTHQQFCCEDADRVGRQLQIVSNLTAAREEDLLSRIGQKATEIEELKSTIRDLAKKLKEKEHDLELKQAVSSICSISPSTDSTTTASSSENSAKHWEQLASSLRLDLAEAEQQANDWQQKYEEATASIPDREKINTSEALRVAKEQNYSVLNLSGSTKE